MTFQTASPQFWIQFWICLVGTCQYWSFSSSASNEYGDSAEKVRLFRADQSQCDSKQKAEKNLLPPSSLKSCPAGNPNAFYNDSTLFFLYNDLAFGFSGTLIQIFWFSYFLRRSQLAEIISSQQMNINLDWGEQNHFKLGVINPQNNKSGPCIRGILTLPYLPYFISIIYGLWRHQNQRCKKRRIWQIYLGYFSEAVLIFGPCTRSPGRQILFIHSNIE